MASTYSREQIDEFLEYIALPHELRHAPPTLDLLHALHVHTISAVPYENLSLHYNPEHMISIDPQHIYHKIVGNKRGRGGYCMEVALLYNRVLLALGFDAYPAGARTRKRLEGVPIGDFPGWIHIVSIVIFPDGSRYHVDVGFGGDGATAPMPLVDGQVQVNLGAQEIRLIRDWMPAQVRKTEDTKCWIYQYRNGVEKEWTSYYSFVEYEFTQDDFEVVNWWAATNAEHSWHPNVQVCIKFLRRSEEEDGNDGKRSLREVIYGKRMLVNELVKENLGGKTQVVQVCRSEKERIEALERWFDVRLTPEEIGGVKGYRTEILSG